MHSTTQLPNQADISRFLEHGEGQGRFLSTQIHSSGGFVSLPRWLPWVDFPTGGSEMKAGLMTTTMIIIIKGGWLLGGQKGGPGSEGCPLGTDLNSRSQA